MNNVEHLMNKGSAARRLFNSAHFLWTVEHHTAYAHDRVANDSDTAQPLPVKSQYSNNYIRQKYNRQEYHRQIMLGHRISIQYIVEFD